MPKEDKTARVAEVINRLALNKCAGTVIGSVLKRGISGGQAKRVNIALSLITRPGLLFLDEPTSGLDSFMANEVATCLSDLAREGRTVVCTIHSPTAKAFSLFDELLMLKAGRIVYNGPTEGAVPYLEAVAGLSCPSDSRFFSLPEWLVDVTADAQPTEVRIGHSKSGTALADMSGTAPPAERLDFAALYAGSDLCKQRLVAASKVKAEAKVRRPGLQMAAVQPFSLVYLQWSVLSRTPSLPVLPPSAPCCAIITSEDASKPTYTLSPLFRSPPSSKWRSPASLAPRGSC
jgi:energy-coupling factor transporter ATP-binding protein EcfA2